MAAGRPANSAVVDAIPQGVPQEVGKLLVFRNCRWILYLHLGSWRREGLTLHYSRRSAHPLALVHLGDQVVSGRLPDVRLSLGGRLLRAAAATRDSRAQRQLEALSQVLLGHQSGGCSGALGGRGEAEAGLPHPARARKGPEAEGHLEERRRREAEGESGGLCGRRVPGNGARPRRRPFVRHIFGPLVGGIHAAATAATAATGGGFFPNAESYSISAVGLHQRVREVATPQGRDGRQEQAEDGMRSRLFNVYSTGTLTNVSPSQTHPNSE